MFVLHETKRNEMITFVFPFEAKRKEAFSVPAETKRKYFFEFLGRNEMKKIFEIFRSFRRFEQH